MGYSGGGDREPTELRSEVNSEELGLFMVVDGARAQRNSRWKVTNHIQYKISKEPVGFCEN